MFQKLYSGSIGRRLGFGFGAVIVLTIIVGLISIFGVLFSQGLIIETIEADFQEGQLVADAHIEMLEARRREDDYLLMYRVDGFEAARATYVDTWVEHIGQLRANVDALLTILGEGDEQDEYEEVSELVAYIDAYESGFLETVRLIEERGAVDDGIVGDFRESAHNLETAFESFTDLQAQVILLQIRRREKDYLLRGNSSYIDNVHTLIDDLKTHIDTMPITPAQANELRGLADAYATDFDDMVTIDNQVNTSIEDYRTAIETLEPILEDYAEGEAEQIKAAEDTIIQVGWSVLSAIVIGLVIATFVGIRLAIMVTRAITTPLNSMLTTVENVSAGDLNQSIEVESDDEVGVLASAFNTMIINLRESMVGLVAKGSLDTAINRYRGFVESVAEGDLENRLDVESAIDRETSEDLYELGISLNEMVESLMTNVVGRESLEGVINQYRAFIEGVAEGDLTRQIDLNHADIEQTNEDLYQLGESLNRMVERLSMMTQQIRETVAAVMTAASEIQSATTQQTASATEQDSTVLQTVSTVDELLMTVNQNTDRAKQVSTASQQSIEVSRMGQGAVSESIAGMQQIQEQVANIATNILTLSERTQQVDEIIAAVNALADQSKLLALNASIEAARAGEEGKGFAVVAMEVRQLAEQSREATARVRDILNEIQQATNTAVMVTEEGSKSAEAGMELVERAGLAIEQLSATLDQAAESSMQITASAQQQANGMEQLRSAMAQIQQATTQSAASAQQSEQSATNLIMLATELEKTASVYQISNGATQ